MATRKKATYEPHSVPTKITATSRCAVKIRDNYYTIEASEERSIIDTDGVDMDKEWAVLFDEVNYIVDGQIKETVESFTGTRK